MNWPEFVGIPNGLRILNHSYDQCVALANLYHEEVIGGAFVPVASAYQWSTDFARYLQLTSNYTQLPAHANPEPGDIFVSRGGIYNSTDGHIGVVVRSWDGSTFGTKEQNAELNRYTYQTYNRSKANMLGYLRPKNNPAASSQKDKFMRVTWDTNGTGYLVTEDGFYGLASMQEYDLFVRLINSTPSAPDRFTKHETEVMNKILSTIAKRNSSSASGGTIDYAALAKAVNDDAARRMQS